MRKNLISQLHEVQQYIEQKSRTQKEIAEYFGVDRQTVKRAIDRLSPYINLSENKDGRNTVYKIEKPQPLEFTALELATLILAQEAITSTGSNDLGSPFADSSKSLLKKVRERVPPAHRKQLDAFSEIYGSASMPAKDFSRHFGTIEMLVKAATDNSFVKLEYRSLSDGKVKVRRVAPYNVYFDPDGATLKLLGFDERRQAIIPFSIDHIVEIEILPEFFKKPVDHDLKTFLEVNCFNGIHGEPITVELKLTGVNARIFSERSFHPSQKIVDPTDGLQQSPISVPDTDDPESVLGYIGEQKTGIFLLCDYAPYISPYGQEDALLVRRLREIAWKLKSTKATVLFVGPSFPELKTLEKEVTQIELDLPKEAEIEDSIELQLDNLKSNGLDIDLTIETQTALLQSLLGLTAGEISNVIAKAVISCNGLNQESIKVILEEKKNVIRGSGSLTYVHPEPACNLGGYKSLRAILERAAYTFSPRAKARHVEPCKGILPVGLPGCGKDLCKRVASSITNRALLDLDFGSIMGEGGGVIGSSAMSIKRALSIAGTIKGILGISEFEKAVSGMKSSNKTDGGETARTISYLLNWMQDNKDVLVFATANDVRELESEQFRIGRFSYIHFVDLPGQDNRAEIFKVHLRKRQRDDHAGSRGRVQQNTQ
ncbi:MAG: AAA family ATPase [Blastocatellia bacterium]